MATAVLDSEDIMNRPYLEDRQVSHAPEPKYREREELLLECSVEASSGRRGYMEDRHSYIVSRLGFGGPQVGVFSVFDGHGGELAADLCEQRFLNSLMEHNHFGEDIIKACRDTVDALDKEILSESKKVKTYAGSTLNSVIVHDSTIYCCNVGDSRSVLCRNGIAQPLSVDHSPLRPAEVKRIREAGGFVSSKGVNGVINVTRALGDLDLKEHKEITFPDLTFTSDLIISEPEFTEFEITHQDEFVIVASDGLWGKITSSAAVKLAKKVLDTCHDARRCAKALLKAAYDAGTLDNITVMVVLLREPARRPKGPAHSVHFLRKMKSLAPSPREAEAHSSNDEDSDNENFLPFRMRTAPSEFSLRPARRRSTLERQLESHPNLEDEDNSVRESFFKKISNKVGSSHPSNDGQEAGFFKRLLSSRRHSNRSNSIHSNKQEPTML
mmetsp:Transcript_9982/g.30478  ORF Transcript_9982/g.30478 Transcript_9982/m.30478 type:complete len:441 (+) Transcript_9982:89-1411(+)|eukprot:CAMPEP_0198730030 /NCGR_PEP_ID=MMETSP1475-20131203/22448_1 /TAXON_ID= ORGANISM="Unidentified sp., Strain CCMP1999" /NCGR_SAMPLE_ID=MMETSP1475 /ASSEMBLY_ACC=CAM_ASM_001111 /LENGTH=440 /DNA_ID=CAMNT_0044492775 /DNA_START=78 /DNA_END=1400 /DNA_ORIENTATION=+